MGHDIANSIPMKIDSQKVVHKKKSDQFSEKVNNCLPESTVLEKDKRVEITYGRVN